MDADMMQLSTKKAALALGVSEASIKRWCDRGTLAAHKTAGGHRRITRRTLIAFVRRTKHLVVRPDILGLPGASGALELVPEEARSLLLPALLAGDAERFRALVIDLFMSGSPLCEIFDKALRPVFNQIGCQWEEGDVEIVQERRCCEMCLDVLHELRTMLPSPSLSYRAMGGTLSGDWYALPRTMTTLVLREKGWHTIPLGNHLTSASLSSTIHLQKPDLFWLSVSHVADEKAFLADQAKVAQACKEEGTLLVMGGRELTARRREKMAYCLYCDTLTHLVHLLDGVFGDNRGDSKRK